VVFRISRWIIRRLLRLFFGFTVVGRHHEPRTGPVIVVSNHLSDLDPLVVGSALSRPVSYMAKEELFKPPLLRWWITACGAFPVRRGEADRRAFRTALEVLRRGGVLVMFPEGTRGRDRTLRPPEPGAAMLALRTGAPLLPVAILGTDLVFPRDARRLRRSRITVRLGAPIHIDGRSQRPGMDGSRRNREDVEEVGRLYMREIARLLA
jgi:1-acyl-sn-glycerol-3-phosphate acyltransferase